MTGCESDEDCNDGLECVGDGTARKCVDINECSDDRFSADTLAHCGMNSTCSNNVGSFSCVCNAGKSSWTANVGCKDTNECLAYNAGSVLNSFIAFNDSSLSSHSIQGDPKIFLQCLKGNYQ